MSRLLILFLFTVTLFSAPMKFLMPDEAFTPSATLSDSHLSINAKIEPAEEIYIYEEYLKAVLKEGSGVIIKDLKISESVEHHGEQVFLEPVHLEITLAKEAGLTGVKEVTLLLGFQGCSEKGLCYEPLEKSFTFQVDTAKLPEAALPSLAALTKKRAEPVVAPAEVKDVVSETDQIAETIKQGNIGLILLTFFGFGLLLSLTPCIFPMIPILSSVIVSQGNGITVKRAFFLSLVYVLAMSVAYTIAGVLAGLFGANLQAAFQTPWVIISFSLLFVLLSLSMFGMYELQLPNFLQSRLTKAGESHSGVAGVAIMGFLSALIVGPCVAAPLAGALIYIGQTGDAVIGGMALFALSIGMGVPLLIVGTTAGKFMPRPGEWMENIKAFFGVLLIGVAIWMISRIVPAPVTLLLTSFLLVFVAVHLGAFEAIGKECVRCGLASKKAAGVLIFMYALMLFIGGFTGGSSLLNPLAKVTAPQSMMTTACEEAAPAEAQFTVIGSESELEAIIAKSKGKKILLDFYADWCVSCKELEEITFADPAVKAKMSEFVLVQADVTDNSDAQKALTKRFGLFGPPGIIFFDEEGSEMKGRELVGFKPPAEFLSHLNQL
ncbi:MAG: protein-disulfide reductase DsbD [Campylobacterota bacterium]|nr:protein-disulfide reductase DsbD [Campylobacterota bacterium]